MTSDNSPTGTTTSVRERTPRGVAAVRMANAAVAWLQSLTLAQREIAQYGPPGDPGDAEDERLTWFFTPTDHGGLTLREQSSRQQGLAMQLVSSGLSLEGYTTACAIMGTENILDRFEGFSVDWGRERGRDPSLYYLRIFGEPGGRGPWGWRFGGHHISLNNLIADDEVVSVTPNFLGSDPAETAFAGGGVLRPLGAPEDLARELLYSLDDEQREMAWLLDRAPADIVGGNRTFIADGDVMPRMDEVWRGRFTEPRLAGYIGMIHDREETFSGYDAEDYRRLSLTVEPKGIPASALSREQRSLLKRVMSCFAGRAPAEIAALEAERYEEPEALDAVCFAWAGAAERGERHYFRVQGPQVLIEYDNTQRAGNHCHTAWRDPVADFGLDVLYDHLDVFHRRRSD